MRTPPLVALGHNLARDQPILFQLAQLLGQHFGCDLIQPTLDLRKAQHPLFVMKIAIIGGGNIGGTLGKKWAKAGHQVVFGVRNNGARHGQTAGV
jgi:hypothetical protein